MLTSTFDRTNDTRNPLSGTWKIKDARNNEVKLLFKLGNGEPGYYYGKGKLNANNTRIEEITAVSLFSTATHSQHFF